MSSEFHSQNQPIVLSHFTTSLCRIIDIRRRTAVTYSEIFANEPQDKKGTHKDGFCVDWCVIKKINEECNIRSVLMHVLPS